MSARQGLGWEESLRKVFDWILAHKAPIGAILAFIAAGLEGTGRKHGAVMVGAAASWLMGAGLHPSDAAEKSFDKPK